MVRDMVRISLLSVSIEMSPCVLNNVPLLPGTCRAPRHAQGVLPS